MYYEHFGFQLPPFSISPDPRFLYLSERHRDALAHLIYGAGENGGFVLLTGQVGTGKTTLIRSLLSQELPDVDIALCLHSGLSVIDFVASILDELSISYPENPASLKPLVDALNKHLLEKHAEGRQTVLIIDEGQNLSREVLEQVRLLTNLETDSQKLLRIILVGQEELQDIINRPDLRQLSQRITGRYHLTPLNGKEVGEYIAHRIKTAKGNPSIITTNAIRQIYRYTDGTPRLINVLCDRALLVAYNSDSYRVTSKHVKIAATETMPKATASHTRHSQSYLKPWLVFPFGLLAILGFSYGAYYSLKQFSNQDTAILNKTSNSTVSHAIQPTAPTSENQTTTKLETSETASQSQKKQINHVTHLSSHKPEVAISAIDSPDTDDESVIKGTPTTSNSTAKKQGELVSLGSAGDEEPITATLEAEPSNDVGEKNKENSLLLPAQVSNNSASEVQELSLLSDGLNQAEGIKILLKRWGLSTNMPANQSACQYAESQNMSCLSVRAGLPLMRTINRPALLELRSDNDTVWLPVIGFDSQNEIICLRSNIPQTCDIGDIIKYWSGNFLVLLKKPTVSVKLTPGFEGEQILWLRQRIAIAEGRDVDTISPSLKFDNNLANKVKDFQKSREIHVDGLIGDNTLLYLHNVVSDEKTPILKAVE